MLAVTAARVLNNMDRDWTTEVLEDGIVILHPLHRSRSVWCLVWISFKLMLLVFVSKLHNMCSYVLVFICQSLP